MVGWLIASGAFALYVANFGSYNKTYGALGGVIVFLVWLWISNIVILLGAEFNAELERGRAIEAGMRPEDKEPFAEPRDTRKMETRNPPREATGRSRAVRRLRPSGGAAAVRRLRDLRGGLPRRAWPARSAAAKRSGRDLPEHVEAGDVVLIGTASHKLSRLISKKKVTSFVRAPFTELEGKGGPAELEEHPRGSGLQQRDGRAARLPLLPRPVGVRRLPRRAAVRARARRASARRSSRR